MVRMVEEEPGAEVKGKNALNDFKKMIVIITMILFGIFLLIYEIDKSYWGDNFSQYTASLLVVMGILAVICLLLLIGNLRELLVYEFKGFIVFMIGAAVLLMVPGRNVLGLGFDEATADVVLAVGTVITIIGAIIIAREGGYLSVTLYGIGFVVVLAGYYPIMSIDVNEFSTRAILLRNIGLGYIILSFLLFIYHDLKFFFLAKLIRDGNSLRNKGNHSAALRKVNTALFLYPNFSTAWNNKGNVLYNMKKYNEALKCYNKAIKINPTYIYAKNNMEVVKKHAARA
jgi:tetratricopeptide (TPR) repeat protein